MAAIKAKLVELGAYVDDELPDYIMVMVANKKTESQMADDLNLFLSGNTLKFTAWLHSLLDKLQSITNLKPVPQGAQIVTEKGQLEFSHSADRLPVTEVVDPTAVVPALPTFPATTSVAIQQSAKDCEIMDDSLLSGINTENYEFDEESLVDSKDEGGILLRESPAVVTSAVVENKKKESRKVSVVASETRKRSSVTNEHHEKLLQPAKVPRVDARTRLGSSRKDVDRRETAKRVTSQHRGGVMSKVGAVLRHDNDDDEEEDDRKRPSTGVASIVKVSDRKSSVPQALQANKSLLMKAMKQAEQSVARARGLSGSESSMTSLTDKQRTSALSRLGLMSSSARQAQQQSVVGRSLPIIKHRVIPKELSDDVSHTDMDSSDQMVVTADAEEREQSINSMDGDEEDEDSQEGDKPDSRNFVVTMQDVKDSSMDQEDDGELFLSSNAHNVVRVKPQTQFSRTVEDGVRTAVVKKPFATERCKFWPACKNADSCQFHHPSIPCRTFPSCRYGDSCLYVHPMCKFDELCRKPQCPYMHSTPRRPAPMAPPMPVIVQPIRVPVYMPGPPPFAHPRQAGPRQIKCKFFPRCSDANCLFMHPKPCHYGASCANRETCAFSHPDWPDKKLLKWTAQPVLLPHPPGHHPLCILQRNPIYYVNYKIRIQLVRADMT